MTLNEVARIIETVYHNKYKLHTTYLYGSGGGYAYKVYHHGRYIGIIADVKHTVLTNLVDVTIVSLPTNASYNTKSIHADVLILRICEEFLEDLRILFKIGVIDTPYSCSTRDFYIEDVRRD